MDLATATPRSSSSELNPEIRIHLASRAMITLMIMITARVEKKILFLRLMAWKLNMLTAFSPRPPGPDPARRTSHLQEQRSRSQGWKNRPDPFPGGPAGRTRSVKSRQGGEGPWTPERLGTPLWSDPVLPV